MSGWRTAQVGLLCLISLIRSLWETFRRLFELAEDSLVQIFDVVAAGDARAPLGLPVARAHALGARVRVRADLSRISNRFDELHLLRELRSRLSHRLLQGSPLLAGRVWRHAYLDAIGVEVDVILNALAGVDLNFIHVFIILVLISLGGN